MLFMFRDLYGILHLTCKCKISKSDVNFAASLRPEYGILDWY